MQLHKFHRRSIRLVGYEYSQNGGYFITICAHQKRCAFGCVKNDAMQLNVYGEIVRDCWLAMPKHFHGIIIIRESSRGLACQAPTMRQFSKPQPGDLPTIVRSFKSTVTRRINQHRAENNLPPAQV
jgi:putative transposase